MLLACDQSVRGFALAWAPAAWGGDWSLVQTARTDGGKVARGDEAGALQRLRRVFQWVDQHLVSINPEAVGFESYGFSANPDTHVVELVGALKIRCMHYAMAVQTVQQSSARKLVAGPAVKIPRKGEDAKKMMRDILFSHDTTDTIRTLDETDALVILNSMLITRGGLPLVPNA